MALGKELAAVAVVLLMGACAHVSPEEEAARAARAYYTRLADDRPADFLEGRAGADSLPADYRRQLVEAYTHYMADMVDRHGGLQRVDVSPSVGRTDTALRVTYAFLLLTFSDSTQEEVTVPMVHRDGRWLMK